MNKGERILKYIVISLACAILVYLFWGILTLLLGSDDLVSAILLNSGITAGGFCWIGLCILDNKNKNDKES